MQDEETDLSSLKTASSFDRGGDSTVAIDLENDELEKFSPSSLLVESLIEQLCRLLEKDPKKCRKLYLSVCEQLHRMRLIDASYERDEFEFMRSYYQKALYQLLTIAKSTSVDKALIVPPVNDSLKISSKGEIQWSRYSNEFEELEYVAKGGFGHVYKAQHKLDGGVYAVKKIYLRYKNISDFLQYIREVKMLAKLNHPNIVSYKAAWLEPLNRKKKYLQAIEMSDDTPEQQEDSLEVVFECSQKISSTTEISSDKDHVLTTSTSITKEVCKMSKFECEDSPNLPEWAVLYIQMQLCQNTLRHWLDVRNAECPQISVEATLEMFIKIVKGVDYIHSQGIVHHDIKPSNVFVSSDLSEVQVGDFGLACSLYTHEGSSVSVISTHDPAHVGTKLYAAPEQLRGQCHPKSDVYSLGIVLFELIQPFNTTMERSKVIGQLKAGHIPSNLLNSYPHVSKIIREMVSNSVKTRPSSRELLSRLEEWQKVTTQQTLAEQKETIRRLRKESMEKDEEIALLRKELQRFKSQAFSAHSSDLF